MLFVSSRLSLVAIQRYGVTGLLFTFFVSAGVNTIVDYYNIHRIYKYHINYEFLIKTLAISLTTYILVYTITTTLILNPWIELAIGGILSLTIYIIGFIATKALTRQDIKYLDNMSTSLGPLAPLIHQIVNLLTRFS